MMRFLRFFVLLVLMLSVFSFSASASGEDEIWRDFSSLIGSEEIEKEEIADMVGVEALLSEILSALSESKGKIAGFFSVILLSAFLISFTECSAFFESKSYHAHVLAAVVTLSGVMIFSFLYPMIEATRRSLEETGGFFASLIPIMTGISAMAGSTVSAASSAVNMNITLSVCSGVIIKLLLPIAMLSFSMSLADGFSLGAMGSLLKTVKGVFNWLLGILCTVIIGGVSMQSVISSATDSVSMRIARTSAAELIPAVGGTVSASLSTLVGGLSYMKDAVGIGSVIFIVSSSLSVLVVLLIYRLALSVGISIMDFCATEGGVRAFSAFRSALDSVIAIFCVSCLIYIIEIVIFMKCGVASFG